MSLRLQKRFLISGASGFIGSALTQALIKKGYEVVALVSTASNSPFILWDFQKNQAVISDFEGFDGVFHLMGEPLTLSRWSQEKREKIWRSRVESARFLAEILGKLQRPPSVFISASAVGYYGDAKEAILTEKSPAGKTFLAGVCRDWEAASLSLEARGIRRVVARFGVVLDPAGGMLRKILPLYRMGLGAVLGNGNQWFSWITRRDLVRALLFLAEDAPLKGAVNCTAPKPLRQKDFSADLAHALHRPCFLKMPAWFLRLGLGTTADEMLLSSARVLPQKLLDAGFHFLDPLPSHLFIESVDRI